MRKLLLLCVFLAGCTNFVGARAVLISNPDYWTLRSCPVEASFQTAEMLPNGRFAIEASIARPQVEAYYPTRWEPLLIHRFGIRGTVGKQWQFDVAIGHCAIAVSFGDPWSGMYLELGGTVDIADGLYISIAYRKTTLTNGYITDYPIGLLYRF